MNVQDGSSKSVDQVETSTLFAIVAGLGAVAAIGVYVVLGIQYASLASTLAVSVCQVLLVILIHRIKIQFRAFALFLMLISAIGMSFGLWMIAGDRLEANNELKIRAVIDKEPRLILRGTTEMLECYVPNAEICDLWHTSDPSFREPTRWRGRNEIYGRYQSIGKKWSEIPSHSIHSIEVRDGHAVVISTTWTYKAGSGKPWQERGTELWYLLQDPSNSWKVVCFYYNVPPQSVESLAKDFWQKAGVTNQLKLKSRD